MSEPKLRSAMCPPPNDGDDKWDILLQINNPNLQGWFEFILRVCYRYLRYNVDGGCNDRFEGILHMVT